MSINKTYAVFGLGRYGMAVAKELVDSGAEVLACDADEVTVNNAANHLPLCKCCDVTEADVIAQLGVHNFDVVIIAMAGSLEASVMATMLCKEAGVKEVIVKCSNEMHMKILSKIGADKVVFPESESGIRLAKNLLSSGFVDMIELSKDASMLELDVKKEWIGRSPMELNLRKKYSVNIVAIRRGDDISTYIDPEAKLDASMKLIVIANPEQISKIK